MNRLATLVRGIGEVAQKAKPFYSPIDKAISEIVQTKGTGDQMLAQILKTKGVAKELKERPAIKAALQQPKITKAELEKVAAENPPPEVFEKVDRGPSEAKYRVEHDDVNDRYDVVDDYSDVVRSFRNYDDAESYAYKLGSGTAKYESYQLPGGKNYREIKLMLPDTSSEARENLRKFQNQMKEKYDSLNWRRFAGAEDQLEHDKLLAQEKKQSFRSSHFSEPNILAHARVSDRTGPNGEKILHVEEIQSDWHQKGRKEGYRDQKENVNEKKYYEYVKDLISRYQDRIANTYAPNETDPLKKSMQIPQALRDERDPQKIAESMGELDKLQDMFVLMYQELSAANKGVPDAPFKQNWHELVMKRLLDDAAKNGYDKVVITPGIEQVKRYPEAMRNIADEIVWNPIDQESKAITMRKNGFSVFSAQVDNNGIVTQSEVPKAIGKSLDELIGKSMAEQAIKNPAGEIKGKDFTVGGKGMEGFYDQMLPAFLNDYGKKWGARVGQYEIYPYEMAEKRKELINNLIKQGHTPESAEKQALGIYPEKEPSILLHSFDITPQMREDIVGKGQPLYQAIPAGVGAGTLAAPQEEVTDQPMKKGGAVHLSQGGEPETPEQQFEHYLRMLRINASGGKDKYGSSVGGRFGVNIPIAKDIFIEPFVQGFVFKPDTGKLMSGGVGGANLNISFKNGGNVSEDAMRLAVLNKKIQHKAGGGKMEVLKAIGRGLRGMREPKNQINIIKEGGGNWLAGNVEGALKPLKREDASVSKPDPLNQWVDKQLTRYIKNQMGTKEDPIRLSAEKNNIHMPTYEIYDPSNSKLMQKRLAAGMPVKNLGKSETARNWENIVDRSIYPNSAGSYVHGSLDPDILKNNPWLTKINPETEVYYATGLRRDLGLDHLVDELRNATNPASGLPSELLIKPESLSKLSVQQAVERVAKINEWRAAQKAEADLLRARNPATVLHKEYPEGYSWYELKNPEGAKNTSALEDALKYEGEQMGHCVGAYCPDVAEGRSRIYSLRDKKGQPHVTIETTNSMTPSEFYYSKNVPESLLNKLSELEKSPLDFDWEKVVRESPEYRATVTIKQIKGKANLAPKEEYLPFVQDFVRSGNWSNVRDLQNTGLMRVDLLKKAGWDLGDINKEYLTKQEFEDIKRGMDNSMKPPYGSTDEGMKRGGFIKFDNKNIDAMRMAVMNKQLRKRHG